MSAQPELWRVSTIEGIFETDLETLKQWIVEGCVLPTDKVSKGSLNWIDAGRVPKLKGAFNGEIVAPPPAPPHTNAVRLEAGWHTPPLVETPEPFESPQTASSNFTHKAIPGNAPANVCFNHPDAQPKYLCRMCATALCEACPRFVGSSNIPVCPLCGDLCKSYTEVITSTVRAEFQSSGFGMTDFLRAVRYPFHHKAALLGGALIYSFLLLAGFRGSLIAWMVMFGCISHVISQVAWGRLDRSFMPDFSGFSLWDDLIVPIFLGIGITIVSWGPVIALVLALIFGVVSSGSVSHLGPEGEMQAAQQQGLSPDDMDVLMDPEADPKKLEEANRKLNELRPGTQIARDAERSKAEQDDPTAIFRQLMPYLGAGVFLLVLLLMGIAWGVFYYPMALTVAGYTQSFWSVVNPLVGLDTIRRMRSTYFKAFGMVLLIQVVAFIVGGIVAFITSPFSLPFVGNLPANFINGSIMFYFNLVIACVLGLSLYKCADRLGIEVD
jgi:hypothetical protein